jgi:hypothetical protein
MFTKKKVQSRMHEQGKVASEHRTYNPVAGLGKTAGKRVDAVGDIRPRPGDGCRRNNLCNTTTHQSTIIKYARNLKARTPFPPSEPPLTT